MAKNHPRTLICKSSTKKKIAITNAENQMIKIKNVTGKKQRVLNGRMGFLVTIKELLVENLKSIGQF